MRASATMAGTPLNHAASQSSILQFLRPLVPQLKVQALSPASTTVAPVPDVGGGPHAQSADTNPADGFATVWFSHSPLSAGEAAELDGNGVIPSAATANDGGGHLQSSIPSVTPQNLAIAVPAAEPAVVGTRAHDATGSAALLSVPLSATPSSPVLISDDTSDDGAGHPPRSALAGHAVGVATIAVASVGGNSGSILNSPARSRKQDHPRRGRTSVRHNYDDGADATGTHSAVAQAAPHARRRRVIGDDADAHDTDTAVAQAPALTRRRRIIIDDEDTVVPHAPPHAGRRRSTGDDDGADEATAATTAATASQQVRGNSCANGSDQDEAHPFEDEVFLPYALLPAM